MSSRTLLTADQVRLLAELVTQRAPILERVLARLGHEPLTDDNREALREVVAAEICDRGLDAEDEPNQYGRTLEHLIDALGHIP
jgi:hypothetical protein